MLGSRDYPIVNKLLTAWDEDDGPVVKNILKEQYFFKQFETEYVKLVQRMNNLPTGTGKQVEKMNEKLSNNLNGDSFGDGDIQNDFQYENVSDESDDLL